MHDRELTINAIKEFFHQKREERDQKKKIRRKEMKFHLQKKCNEKNRTADY